eukprot:4755940-Karenia_brevis.AAC.1
MAQPVETSEVGESRDSEIENQPDSIFADKPPPPPASEETLEEAPEHQGPLIAVKQEQEMPKEVMCTSMAMLL